MSTTTNDWLDRKVEQAIDPELPIIDPHHHMLARRARLQQYLLPRPAGRHRPAGTGSSATVFMDCMWGTAPTVPRHMQPVGETETAARRRRETSSGSKIPASSGAPT